MGSGQNAAVGRGSGRLVRCLRTGGLSSSWSLSAWPPTVRGLLLCSRTEGRTHQEAHGFFLNPFVGFILYPLPRYTQKMIH